MTGGGRHLTATAMDFCRASVPNRSLELMIPTFCGVRNKVGSCALQFPVSSALSILRRWR